MHQQWAEIFRLVSKRSLGQNYPFPSRSLGTSRFFLGETTPMKTCGKLTAIALFWGLVFGAAPAAAGEAGKISCSNPGCGYHYNLKIGGGMIHLAPDGASPDRRLDDRALGRRRLADANPRRLSHPDMKGQTMHRRRSAVARGGVLAILVLVLLGALTGCGVGRVKPGEGQ